MSEVVYKLNKYLTRMGKAQTMKELSAYVQKIAYWNNINKQQQGGSNQLSEEFSNKFEDILKKVRERISQTDKDSEKKVEEIITKIDELNTANETHGKAFIEIAELIENTNKQILEEIGKGSPVVEKINQISDKVDNFTKTQKTINDVETTVLYEIASPLYVSKKEELKKIIPSINLFVKDINSTDEKLLIGARERIMNIMKIFNPYDGLTGLERLVVYRQTQYKGDTEAKEIIDNIFDKFFKDKNYLVETLNYDNKQIPPEKNEDLINKEIQKDDEEEFYNIIARKIIENALLREGVQVKDILNELLSKLQVATEEEVKVEAPKVKEEVKEEKQKGGRPLKVIKLNVKF